MTLQETAHYVKDGEIRRTACPRVVYYLQYCLTSTNDQPLHDGTRNFICADNLCVTAQYPSSIEVEHTIEKALDELTIYYRSNSLRANPDKTQVTAFHMKNREAKRALEVKWNNTDLENAPHPKYLGVILDITLSYKQHTHKTSMKVATRNNLLKKLSNSKCGCNASTIRTTEEVYVLEWKRRNRKQMQPTSTRPDSSRETIEEKMLI